jgi:hypothetical protein
MTPTKGLGLVAAFAMALIVAAPTVSFAMDSTSPKLRNHSPILVRTHGHGHGHGHSGGKGRRHHHSPASHKSPGRNN